MNYVPYAVPFFILAMLLELIYGKLRRRQTYSFSDTINSLSLGVISRLIDILRLSFSALVFASIVAFLGISQWSMVETWQWIFAFVAYDFCYYWKHRFGHESRLFWASHVAHHQSEEFNLSTALRQTGTDYIGFIFYIPLFFIGLPPEAVITVGSINLIYQFWVHTEHVPALGVIEWILITPSNHRVHHARNPEYLDKNYGGVFIIWDRLFGSYQKELKEKPCVYGITTGLHSWNPVWANFHVWRETFLLSLQTKSWRDKFLVWIKPPGWLPQDISAPEPYNWQAEKFNPAVDLPTKLYVFVQFWIVTILSLVLLDGFDQLPRSVELLSFAWMIYSLFVFGGVMENKNAGYLAEITRLILMLVLSVFIFVVLEADFKILYSGLSLVTISLVIWWRIHHWRSSLPATQ